MSSVFTSLVNKTLAVPHDDKQTVTIRKLSPGAMRAATRASQLQAINDLNEMGGPEFLKKLNELSDRVVEAAVERDPMLVYDRISLLNKGVVAWSYDKPTETASYEDLDEETGSWLAEQIMRLSNPRLFASADEQQDAEKNG